MNFPRVGASTIATFSPENVEELGVWPRSADALRPVPGPRYARIKRVRLPVDTRMVDDQDEVDEFEFEFEDEFEDEDYESLKDRVRRGPILGVLLGATLFAGAIWVVLNAIVDIHFARGFADFVTSETEGELWIWVQAVREIAHSIFLVALGSYVVLWLALRDLDRDAAPS
jgi:hypothetical protein